MLPCLEVITGYHRMEAEVLSLEDRIAIIQMREPGTEVSRALSAIY